MPCDAIATATALVDLEKSVTSIMTPEQIEMVIDAYLEKNHLSNRIEAQYYQGQIIVRGLVGMEDTIRKVEKDLSKLMKDAARMLLVKKTKSTLKQLGGNITGTTQKKKATVISLTL